MFWLGLCHSVTEGDMRFVWKIKESKVKFQFHIIILYLHYRVNRVRGLTKRYYAGLFVMVLVLVKVMATGGS